MWKLTILNEPKTATDLRIISILKEMKDSYSWDSESLKEHFKLLVKEISRSNNFSADLMYKVTPINNKSVDVWKLDVKGNYKRKMVKMDYYE